VHTSKTKRSPDFIALLQRLDGLDGPRLGLPIKAVVIVVDNGPIHMSKATRAALAAGAHWLTVEWLRLNSTTPSPSGAIQSPSSGPPDLHRRR
jgi:hypothetical protein